MLFYASAIGWALCNDNRCLSVCSVSDPKSRTKGHCKLKIGKGNSVSLCHVNAEMKTRHIFGEGSKFKLDDTVEIRWPASSTRSVISKVKDQDYIASRRQFAHNSTTKSRRSTKICRPILATKVQHTSSKVKRSNVLNEYLNVESICSPAHHSHPPSHVHCFIPGSKLTFSTNLFHHSLLAPTWTAFSDYTGPDLLCSTAFHF